MKKKRRFAKLVKPTTRSMAGKTKFERELNCWLTKQFIWGGSKVPHDECLNEARMLIEMFSARLK